MADAKTSDLVELVVPDAGDWLPIADISVPETKKVKFSRFVTKDASSDVQLDASTYSAGTLHGGVAYARSLQISPTTYTQTADPADQEFGSFVNVKWNTTLDYAGTGGVGPLAQSGYFGPRGVFNLEGTAVYKNSTGQTGLSPLAFLSVMTQKNFSGSALTLTPAWTFVASNLYLAHAATVTARSNDTLDGPAAFIDTTQFTTGGTGTYNGNTNSVFAYSYVSYPAIHGTTHLAGRVGFEVRDYQSTNGGATYSLSNGESVTLDNTTATVDLQVGVRVPRLTKATTNIGIRCNSPIELWQDTVTFTAALPAFALLDTSGTFTLDFANAAMVPVLRTTQTLIFKQAAYVLGSFTTFHAAPTIKNHTSLSGAVWGINSMFLCQPTITADTNSVSSALAWVAFNDSTTLSVANGGTLTWAGQVSFASSLAVGASTTATLRQGFNFADATGAGAVTTQVGIDIAALTKGGTNIGIRNAATTVDTPTVKTITAVGDTIPATATVIRLNNTSGSSKTLTSAPTIADGQDGQELVVFNSSANDVVLQDQGTLASSNLRLGAATRTLSTRDSIIFRFSSTIGDWIEVAFSNVV